METRKQDVKKFKIRRSVEFSSATARCILWRFNGHSHGETCIQQIRPPDKSKCWKKRMVTQSTRVSSHKREAVFSIVRKIYGRERDDPMDDLDVNMAIWGIFLNATLRAAVHLEPDHEANLRYVLCNSVGQSFHKTGKLISEQKEITGVSTHNFRELTWMSTGFCAAELIRSPTPKPSSSPTLCSVWEKLEMILLRHGRAKLNGIQKTITSRIWIELTVCRRSSSG